MGYPGTTPKHYCEINMEDLEGSGHAQVDVNNQTVDIWRFSGKRKEVCNPTAE